MASVGLLALDLPRSGLIAALPCMPGSKVFCLVFMVGVWQIWAIAT